MRAALPDQLSPRDLLAVSCTKATNAIEAIICRGETLEGVDRGVFGIALPADPPEWVQLIPGGTFSTRDGRGPFTLKDAATVIARSTGRALEADGAIAMPIDFDHQLEYTEKNGGGAPAAGWIRELQARGDGIYGRVEWCADGADAIRARRYRFLSPVFYSEKNGTVTLIESAALTNKAALPQLKALAARENDQGPLPAREGKDHNDVSTQTKSLLARLNEIFGLAAENTDEAAALARVSALKESNEADRKSVLALVPAVGAKETDSPDVIVKAALAKVASAGTVDPTKYVPIDQHQKVAASLAELQGKDTDRAVDAAIAAGKITPANREWAKQLAATDRAAFDSFVSKAPVLVEPGTKPGDRAPAAGEPQLTDDDKRVCAQLDIAPEKFISSKKES